MFYNKSLKQYLFFFLILIELYGCLTGGTHGSIKAYEYPVSKKILEKAVEKVIAENPDIHRDTTRNYMVDITNGKNDTIIDNHYNDGERYLSIKIESNRRSGKSNSFIFQYAGTEQDWDTAKTSSIFIAYAYDEDGNGGSEGNGEVSWHTPLLKKKLTNLFERNFIDRIDKELEQNHTDAN